MIDVSDCPLSMHINIHLSVLFTTIHSINNTHASINPPRSLNPSIMVNSIPLQPPPRLQFSQKCLDPPNQMLTILLLPRLVWRLSTHVGPQPRHRKRIVRGAGFSHLLDRCVVVARASDDDAGRRGVVLRADVGGWDGGGGGRDGAEEERWDFGAELGG